MYPTAWYLKGDGYYLNIDHITSKKKWNYEDLEPLYNILDATPNIPCGVIVKKLLMCYVPALGAFFKDIYEPSDYVVDNFKVYDLCKIKRKL